MNRVTYFRIRVRLALILATLVVLAYPQAGQDGPIPPLHSKASWYDRCEPAVAYSAHGALVGSRFAGQVSFFVSIVIADRKRIPPIDGGKCRGVFIVPCAPFKGSRILVRASKRTFLSSRSSRLGNPA